MEATQKEHRKKATSLSSGVFGLSALLAALRRYLIQEH